MMIKAGRLAGDRGRAAAFAVEQGHLAEKLARAVLVEHQLLAFRRVGDDQDAAGEDAVQAVGRVVAQEDHLARPDNAAMRWLEQCLDFAVVERAQERMQSQQVLRGHWRSIACAMP